MKQTLELHRVHGHGGTWFNTWNNDYMYADGKGAHFWCEIAEFWHDKIKGVFRVWIIETPNGKFSHDSQQKDIKYFCSNFSDSHNLQQAKILMDLKVSQFMNCHYEIKLIEPSRNIILPAYV